MDNSTRVIIINFNAGEALLRCVASVLNTIQPLYAVVADNQSTDRSCEVLRSRYGSSPRLEILENAQNLGFGRAVNACAANAIEPYLLVLNPDCELFPETLLQLRQALETDEHAAMAAPCIVDRQGKVMKATVRTLPTPWKALMAGSGLWRLGRWIPLFRGVELSCAELPSETSQVEAVSGACMLIRAEAFLAVGGFDEAYGLHFEDLDLMVRLQQQSWHCLYVPQAKAFHESGVSSSSRPLWVHRQKHAGMQRYFSKHVFPKRGVLTRMLLSFFNWLHYGLTLPLVWLRRGK